MLDCRARWIVRAVFLLTGIMASGKSTVAQLLAERLPRAAHVRGDAFGRMIVTGRREMTPGAGPEAEVQLELRYRLAATADAYFGAGFSVVVQDVVLGGWLPRFVDLAQGRPLLMVVLAPARRWWRPGKRTGRRPATPPGPRNSWTGA